MIRRLALLIAVATAAVFVGAAAARPRTGPSVYRTLHFGGRVPTGVSFPVRPGRLYRLAITLNPDFRGAVQACSQAEYSTGEATMAQRGAWTFPPSRGTVYATFRAPATAGGVAVVRGAINVQAAPGSYADVHVTVYDITDEATIRITRPSVMRYRR